MTSDTGNTSGSGKRPAQDALNSKARLSAEDLIAAYQEKWREVQKEEGKDQWDFEGGHYTFGEVVYAKRKDGGIQTWEGHIGPQNLHALGLATDCEAFIERTLIAMGVPPVVKRDGAWDETRIWHEGEKKWAAIFRNRGIVFITDKGLIPPEVFEHIGLTAIQHPRLFHAFCFRDSIDEDPPSDCFEQTPTFEEYWVKHEPILKMMEKNSLARPEPPEGSPPPIPFEKLVPGIKKRMYEDAVKKHYSKEVRDKKLEWHFIQRAHRLTVFSLVIHWWENLGGKAKALAVANPVGKDPEHEPQNVKATDSTEDNPRPSRSFQPNKREALRQLIGQTCGDPNMVELIAESLCANRKPGSRLKDEASEWLRTDQARILSALKLEGKPSIRQIRDALTSDLGITLSLNTIQETFSLK